MSAIPLRRMLAEHRRWATTLALCDADDVFRVAVVVQPTAGRVYTAERGRGAWCNADPIRVASTVELERAVVGVGILSRGVSGTVDGLADSVMGLRVSGSTVCDLCDVAAGVLDGFWQATIVKRWDLAAGTLLVSEAGGTVTSADGMPLAGPAESILAGTPSSHSELAKLLT